MRKGVNPNKLFSSWNGHFFSTKLDCFIENALFIYVTSLKLNNKNDKKQWNQILEVSTLSFFWGKITNFLKRGIFKNTILRHGKSWFLVSCNVIILNINLLILKLKTFFFNYLRTFPLFEVIFVTKLKTIYIEMRTIFAKYWFEDKVLFNYFRPITRKPHPPLPLRMTWHFRIFK